MLKRYLMEMPLLRWAHLLALLLLLPVVGRAQYSPNNIVVVRFGDGATTLSATAAPVSLLEYTSAGTLVNTLPLNSTGTAPKLTNSGSSTSEGSVFRSSNGLQLSLAGYDAVPGTASLTATSTQRSVATIDGARTATIQDVTLAGSTTNHRSAATAGTGYYSGTSSGGVQYYPNAATTAIQLSSDVTNVRVVGEYGGQLYATSATGSNFGLNTVGTGTPTTSGQTTTLIAGTGGTSSPYGFVLFDQSPTVAGFDVAYIADDRTSAGGGIYKFSKVGTTWTLNGVIASTVGARGLAGRVTPTGVELYANSTTALYRLVDATGYNVAPTVTFSAAIATSGANYAFRGVAFGPATFNLAVTQGATSYPSSGTSYDFGNQALNTASPAVAFTLTNSGTGPLDISGITTTGDYAVSGTAPTSVPAAGTATVNVTFTPTATGTRTGTLVINSNATNAAAYTVNLTGTGTAPSLAVTQGSTSYPSGGAAYGFGNQTLNTSSSAVVFTLTNSGNSALAISGIVAAGDFAISGTVPTTVAAGGTATVSATFTPTATGTRTGSLTISSNASNGATYVVNLTGNGQAAALPDLTVSSGTLASPTPIAGNYNNVTIADKGVAALVGPLTAAGAFTIQAGGILAQNCQILGGTGSFDLQAGGTLIICDPAGIAPTGVPTGAVLLAGTRTYSPLANYIYNGTAAQVTGLGLPTTVLAVGVANPANVTLSQALSLSQGLNLSQGNLNTGGFAFTLLSSATGTAGVVNAGGIVVGNTTVQRYINSSNSLGYRHYSAPVSGTTFADLNAPGFTPVFNPSYNNSATPGAVRPFPTVFGYNQDRIATVTSNASAFDKAWFSPAGSSDPMVVGKGYTVNAPNTALVDFVGTLNNGPVPSGTLSRGSSPAAGWHLLGNPYPSPLDWSTVAPPQRPGMDAAIYVFESAGQYGGSYRASVNGVGGNGNSPQPIVVAGQGYFVRVATGQPSGQVNIDNPNRVTTFGPQPSFGRGTADTRPQVALTLQGASVADAAYVYFQAGATAGKDVESDATKLPNSHGLNLTSLAGGEALAINGLPVLGTATVLVPLNVDAPQAGSYSLKAEALANLAGTTVTLVDALTSTRTVLSTGTTYAFSLSGTTAAGRFSLEFRPAGALATTPAQALSAQTQLFPNPASASFRVQLPVLGSKAVVAATLTNTLGQTVLSRSLSAPAGQAIDAEFDVRALAAGVYTLRLTVDGTLLVRKVVVE
ncbi:hypothetical protein ACVWYF_002586 [Hymenobacter sp. UYAg731]